MKATYNNFNNICNSSNHCTFPNTFIINWVLRLKGYHFMLCQKWKQPSYPQTIDEIVSDIIYHTKELNYQPATIPCVTVCEIKAEWEKPPTSQQGYWLGKKEEAMLPFVSQVNCSKKVSTGWKLILVQRSNWKWEKIMGTNFFNFFFFFGGWFVELISKSPYMESSSVYFMDS